MGRKFLDLKFPHSSELPPRTNAQQSLESRSHLLISSFFLNPSISLDHLLIWMRFEREREERFVYFLFAFSELV
jgi:hypothetical protein